MCGIFCSLGSAPIHPTPETQHLLVSRGPDSVCTHTFHINGVQSRYLTFISTVLSLRGDHVYAQPLVDPATQSVLCWNGEAWKIAGERVQGNDTEHIFNLFLRAVTLADDDGDCKHALHKLASAIASISGPFSFVFFDARNSRLFFSRDCLGRRSLLQGLDENGSLKIVSVCDGSSSSLAFEEVGTDGIHMIDLNPCSDLPLSGRTSVTEMYKIETLPWSSDPQPPAGYLKSPLPPMNMSIPMEQPPPLTADSQFVQDLEARLRESLKLRIQNVPEPPGYVQGHSAKIAVLFSGGLDCTLLARLSHDLLPLDEPIDLLNVAFENPRVAAAENFNRQKSSTPSSSPPPSLLSIYEACPDRITGRSAHKELQTSCPGRIWRFIAINIPYEETLVHRDQIKRLMRPHNTEMDLSIACALYFAARGKGTTQAQTTSASSEEDYYTTCARILLSGLGADELFAGYGRHGVAFTKHGFEGLVSEIHLDVSRLGQRNLGRDDRVLSHWSRETRFPYLDEEFVAWVLRAPVWEKCGFGLPLPVPLEEQQLVDDGSRRPDAEKLALRLVALRLGLRSVSLEKKRAIQFGARTAKMETGRSRGTDTLD
ncbi:uncharacterized protein PFLUO_LOCUS8995 [Penicillium psychrofluorescens]|uniref:uncharacterized protein n=1 Tax=Penicillium psychrofluorescens TaxID=3158075 RepID=UPI003CCE3B47